MEGTRETWSVPRTVSQSHPPRGFGSEPKDRSRVPQFHIKFDDFFETVQTKATDLNAPEPAWKYLSCFAMKKGTPSSVNKEGLDNILVPRRGSIVAARPSTKPTEKTPTVGHYDDTPSPLATDEEERSLTNPQQPVALEATAPPPQQEMPAATARQTRSGRVIKIPPATIKALPFATRESWPGSSS